MTSSRFGCASSTLVRLSTRACLPMPKVAVLVISGDVSLHYGMGGIWGPERFPYPNLFIAPHCHTASLKYSLNAKGCARASIAKQAGVAKRRAGNHPPKDTHHTHLRRVTKRRACNRPPTQGHAAADKRWVCPTHMAAMSCRRVRSSFRTSSVPLSSVPNT